MRTGETGVIRLEITPDQDGNREHLELTVGTIVYVDQARCLREDCLITEDGLREFIVFLSSFEA